MPAEPLHPNAAPHHPPSPASTVADTRALMEDLHTPELLTLPEIDADDAPRVLVLPRGMEARSVKGLIDEYRDRPERRAGTAVLTDLELFIAWVNRFKDSNSAIFVERSADKPTITGVIDYHEAGGEADVDPRFCRHRGIYRFPLSEPWQAWAAIDGKPLSHGDFAAWLEDRIGDVIAPPDRLAVPDALSEADLKLIELLKTLGGQFVGPSRLLDLSRGLKLTEEARFISVQNLTSGEVELAYQNEHREDAGAPLKVPNIFLLGIPVFDRGAMYRIPVRLRYRLSGSKLTWFVVRYRPQLSFNDALDEDVEEVRSQTDLPVFSGAPEI